MTCAATRSCATSSATGTLARHSYAPADSWCRARSPNTLPTLLPPVRRTPESSTPPSTAGPPFQSRMPSTLAPCSANLPSSCRTRAQAFHPDSAAPKQSDWRLHIDTCCVWMLHVQFRRIRIELPLQFLALLTIQLTLL